MRGKACSGSSLPVVPASLRFEINIAPRSKRRRDDDEWLQGLRADKRGRWAVDEIFAVRRSPTGGRRWEALVCWAGPFDSEWLPSQLLCGEAKREAQHLMRLETVRAGCKRTAGEGDRDDAGPRLPLRRSPRLMAPADACSSEAGRPEAEGVDSRSG